MSNKISLKEFMENAGVGDVVGTREAMGVLVLFTRRLSVCLFHTQESKPPEFLGVEAWLRNELEAGRAVFWRKLCIVGAPGGVVSSEKAQEMSEQVYQFYSHATANRTKIECSDAAAYLLSEMLLGVGILAGNKPMHCFSKSDFWQDGVELDLEEGYSYARVMQITNSLINLLVN